MVGHGILDHCIVSSVLPARSECPRFATATPLGEAATLFLLMHLDLGPEPSGGSSHGVFQPSQILGKTLDQEPQAGLRPPGPVEEARWRTAVRRRDSSACLSSWHLFIPGSQHLLFQLIPMGVAAPDCRAPRYDGACPRSHSRKQNSPHCPHALGQRLHRQGGGRITLIHLTWLVGVCF